MRVRRTKNENAGEISAREVKTSIPLVSADVLDILTALVDKSLVVYEEQGGQARYRLLETVLQYARDRLLESGETATYRTPPQGLLPCSG